MSKRKAYRPKQVNPMAHVVAFQGSHILSKPDQLKQALNLATAVSNISKTGGLKEDWLIVFDVVNMVNVMDDEGRVIQGAAEFVGRCQDVAEAAMDRRKAGTAALKAAELQTLRELQTLWAEILGGMTYSDWARCTKAVALRVASALVHGTKSKVLEAA